MTQIRDAYIYQLIYYCIQYVSAKMIHLIWVRLTCDVSF